MISKDERTSIREAMVRLLAGTPLRSDGALTIVALATEAEVKRHFLTHRHTDLRDEFYAKVRAQGRVPESERRLRERLAHTEERLRSARKEIAELKEANEAFARIVNVLTVEKAEFRKAPSSRSVIPMKTL